MIIRLQNCLTVFDSVSKLIRLFEATVVDLGPILLLFMVWTVVYTIWSSAFRLDYDPTAYPHLPVWL